MLTGDLRTFNSCNDILTRETGSKAARFLVSENENSPGIHSPLSRLWDLSVIPGSNVSKIPPLFSSYGQFFYKRISHESRSVDTTPRKNAAEIPYLKSSSRTQENRKVLETAGQTLAKESQNTSGRFGPHTERVFGP